MKLTNASNQLVRRAMQIVLVAVNALPAVVVFADDMPLPKISEGRGLVKTDGAELYQSICQACHMSAGQGASGAGAYPALANNPKVAASGYIVYNVLNGRHGMPGFAYFLNDVQVAAVSNYVRTHFGNNYADAITPAEVAKLRLPSKGVFEE